ncbi:hypothetical protein BV22DRAFT_474168 [Leucogyrophana mollusca]|uniref:Uncharacterized protein n=1 Tax=Leucogyrophana mollusca TaxID=85980 RepID=A0ACB8BJB4_9AGAM|nr:hypothetical protein BV22DRAFT_474168 [Leucogyrophana mollusca]
MEQTGITGSAVKSAIAFFSDTMSMFAAAPKSRVAVTNYTARKSANHLPTELLLIIFRMMFEDTINMDMYIERGWLVERCGDDDILSPSLFPYAVASVCPRWRDIMSSVPVFWTRVVITVDPDSTSPLAIQSCFDWAGDLPLRVFVTRNRNTSAFPDTGEVERVARVMELLRPHICHTEKLTFDVLHHSSLPLIWEEHCSARYLWVLKLVCQRDDGEDGGLVDLGAHGGEPGYIEEPVDHSEGDVEGFIEGTTDGDQNDNDKDGDQERDGSISECESNERAPPRLSVPFLENFTIGGRAFRNFFIGQPDQLEWLYNIPYLTISGYRRLGDETSGISMRDLFRTISNLPHVETITIDDVEFDHDMTRLTGPLYFESLTLRNLSEDALSNIFGGLLFVAAASISIINCSVEGVIDIDANDLTLVGLDSTIDLSLILEGWTGRQLTLRNCACVNDGFLIDMAESNSDLMEFSASGLQSITVIDCDHLSVGGLRRMVEARLVAAEEQGYDGLQQEWNYDDTGVVCAIQTLSVSGCGPLLDDQDTTWLKQHVRRFSWSS